MGSIQPRSSTWPHTPTKSFLKPGMSPRHYGPLHPGNARPVAATIHQLVTHQPGSRYWPSNGANWRSYLSLSIVIGGFCFGGYAAPLI